MATRSADLVVVGGGVMGTSILYNLAANGVTNTVLLEQSTLASGSTSRSQAILRTHYSNEVTTRMAWESLKQFRDFEEITGTPSGYVNTGYFIAVTESEREALRRNVEMQQAVGVDTTILGPEDVPRISPLLAAEEGEVFAYEPESGYADPYSVTNGFAGRARELGATVRTDARVTGIDIEGGRVSAVRAGEERIETNTAVVAAGPWSRKLLAGIGVNMPLSMVRHQVVMIRRPDSIGQHPILGDVVNDMSPRPDVGNITMVGVGEDEHDGSPEDFDQGVDMAKVEQTMVRLAKRIPGMEDGLFRGGWSGLFTVTPDWHPVLDAVEGIDGLYCAVGFSGHGFKLSPMVGQLMAELIVDGRASTIDISMLNLGRFATGELLESRYTMQVLA